MPLLTGNKPRDWSDDFYAEYSMRVYCRTDMRTIRTPQWKLIRDFLNPTRDELYDLVADPEESRNRISDTSDPAVRAAIAALDIRVREKMRLHRDPALALIDPHTK